MSLLEQPQALALLADAELTADDVRGCKHRLTRFLKRYLPLFYRLEQADLAQVVIQGKLSNLQRKTSEPIAYAANRTCKPVQHFVGAGKWDDEAVMAELRCHASEVIGDLDGVFLIDGSSFPKKGTESCGVARQWCGRLGKVDNCQTGVFLGYVSKHGSTFLDRQLYLPQERADDEAHRDKCHVPEEVVFQEKWRIALDLIERSREVPHGWVVADDEFGRVSAFRARLRLGGEHYVVDVPSNTLVREVSCRADGSKPAFERVEAWAARQPRKRWKTIQVRAGEKGPKVVEALRARVQAKDEGGGAGMAETLVVIRTQDDDGRLSYHLSHAEWKEDLWQLVYVGDRRHCVEELLQLGKGEVGLGHYEVRSWVGWHHHMTLSMLALWYLSMERERMGEKNPGDDGAAVAGGDGAVAASEAAELWRDSASDQRGAAAYGESADIPLP
jgi:SRSO17 transposase